MSERRATDAWRATAGVVAGFFGVVLLAGLMGLLIDRSETPSAGAERAQLALQAIGFAVVAVVLARVLGLGRDEEPGEAPLRPGGGPSAADEPRHGRADRVLVIVAVGAAAATGAYLVGPLVAELWPALADRPTPVGDLGIGGSVGADLATVVIVAGLVPLGEELLFRGTLAGAWLRANRPGIAVLASTVLFGLAHVTVGARTMVIAALLGALLAGALLVAQSLGAVVLAHGLVNGMALLEAGLEGTTQVLALVVVIVGATVGASRLSPLVSWDASGDTLKPVTRAGRTADDR